MRTWKSIAAGGLAAALIFIAASGCAYMHVQMPMGTNFDNTQLGTREGRSDSYSILWLVAWGDAGTKAAAAGEHQDHPLCRYRGEVAPVRNLHAQDNCYMATNRQLALHRWRSGMRLVGLLIVLRVWQRPGARRDKAFSIRGS